MTTRAWTFPIEHLSDATFRAWVTDFAAKLAEVGLVQTADTGQINIATATRPVVTNGVAAGYQIWKFSDNSIFLKFEYGTANGATDRPGIWCTVGTGSDGSGTLTGTVSSRRSVVAEVGISSPGTARLSYMSHSVADGFFGFIGYINALGADRALGTLIVARSVDANGTPNNQGATVYWRNFGNFTAQYVRVQALNFLTNTANPVVSDGSCSFVPHSITNTAVGSNQQAFVHWTAFPRVAPVMQMATVSCVEFPSGATFSATLVGASPKNYICVDEAMYPTTQSNIGIFRYAMLWE